MNTSTLARHEPPSPQVQEADPSGPRQRRWNQRLEQLSCSRAAGNSTAGPLYSWLRAQRRAKASGTLATDRKAALDAAVPGWEGTDPHQQWMERAEDLANYVDLAGKLPAAGGAQTSVLYRWMNYQRNKVRNGQLSKKRIKWLDRYVPGWNTSAASSTETKTGEGRDG